MARQPKKATTEKLWERAKWVGFADIRLNEQEKREVKAMQLSPDAILQFLTDAATAGNKVSLSYSIPEDVYTVSLTGQYKQKPNAGMTLTMRHRDIERAITAVFWCSVQDSVFIDWTERFGSTDDMDW